MEFLNDKIQSRKVVYLGLLALTALLIYQLRGVITPFAFAACLAYLLNPLISFLQRKFNIPRGLSIGLIYLLIIFGTIFGVVVVSNRLVKEADQLRSEMKTIFTTSEEQIRVLPDWSQGIAYDVLDSIKTTTQMSPKKMLPFFSGALGRTVNVLVFIMASFYFLKDGRKIYQNLKNSLPQKIHKETDELVTRINAVLGSYLRGQLILVLIMSATTYICLIILGVPYALMLSVFTGFAEVVPYIGPIVAASVAVFVAATDVTQNFGLNPVGEIVVVIIIYTILRQLEDLLIIPSVIGKMTKLHPLVVLFAVVAGAHLFGPWGLIVAVPLAATTKVVVEYLLEKTS